VTGLRASPEKRSIVERIFTHRVRVSALVTEAFKRFRGQRCLFVLQSEESYDSFLR